MGFRFRKRPGKRELILMISRFGRHLHQSSKCACLVASIGFVIGRRLKREETTIATKAFPSGNFGVCVACF